MDWRTARGLPWNIVLLFGGGFALASGFKDSGLSIWFGEQLTWISSAHPIIVIFCICGSFILDLDDGRTRQSVRLDRDNVGVRLGPGLWHCMHSFSSGCVLLVAASDWYDEADYIRDYDDFRAWVDANGSAD